MGQISRVGAATALTAATLPAMAQIMIHQGYSDPSQVQGNAAWSTQVINGVGNNSHLPIVSVTNSGLEAVRLDRLSAVVTRTSGTPATDDWYLVVHNSVSDLLNKNSWDANAATYSLGGAPSSWNSYAGRLELWFDNIGSLGIHVDSGQSLYVSLANKAPAVSGAVRLSTTDVILPSDDYTYKGDRVPTVLTLSQTPGADNKNFAYNIYAEPVPEPAGLAALSLGVAALAARRRVKKD